MPADSSRLAITFTDSELEALDALFVEQEYAWPPAAGAEPGAAVEDAYETAVVEATEHGRVLTLDVHAASELEHWLRIGVVPGRPHHDDGVRAASARITTAMHGAGARTFDMPPLI